MDLTPRPIPPPPYLLLELELLYIMHAAILNKPIWRILAVDPDPALYPRDAGPPEPKLKHLIFPRENCNLLTLNLASWPIWTRPLCVVNPTYHTRFPRMFSRVQCGAPTVQSSSAKFGTDKLIAPDDEFVRSALHTLTTILTVALMLQCCVCL